MAAGTYDITIEQGTTFALYLTIKNSDGSPKDLTGYTIAGKIRQSALSASVVQTFTCAVTDASAGQVTVSLTAVQTAALPTSGGAYDELTTYVYDIETTSGSSVVERLLQGRVFVSPEVTK